MILPPDPLSNYQNNDMLLHKLRLKSNFITSRKKKTVCVELISHVTHATDRQTQRVQVVQRFVKCLVNRFMVTCGRLRGPYWAGLTPAQMGT